MEIVVRIIHAVAAAPGLIVLVILQPGKSAGLSSFGSDDSGPREKEKGREDLYAKMTVYFAVAFLVCWCCTCVFEARLVYNR